MKSEGRTIEPLVFWWTFGVVIAYIFLIGLISWLVFQGVLLWQAYCEGNIPYIEWKLGRYAVIALVYVAIGGFFRAIRFI